MVVENKIQRYESYKDSGVEWLGEIPEHWKTERAKWLFIKNERPTRKDDQIVTCFRDGEVTLRTNRKKSGFTVALKEHGYQGIRKGDLIIHAMDAFAGAIGVSDSDGKATPVYSVCTERFPNTINQYYYSYFLRSLALNGIILALAKGIRERSTDFRFSDFGELLLSLPPLPEQTAIAQFLDDKITKIDAAIAIKTQQISLLKERKQIVIHKAVTRGLDDSVPLKDSGVKWIGEIPEHWEVKRLKHCLKINNGSDYKHLQTDKGYPVIGSGGQFAYASDYMYDGEVVLLGRKGTIDKPLYFKGKFWAVDTMFYANAINENIVKFLYYLATTLPFSYYSTATALPSMTQGDLNNHPISRPPLFEQKQIVEYIETASQKIETAIGLKQQEIEKLQEYKSSLINSVVTGKVRVC